MTSKLPNAATSFVGRANELCRLRDTFAAGAQLVTIWGPAGIGKTRLALQYARCEKDCITVDLTDARSIDDIDAACASALASLQQPRDTIGDALARRGSTLFILDNFEHVIEHAPSTLGKWCSDAPDARFLVTSRERLRLRAEHTLELGPLSLPQNEVEATSEAVQLFVDRVRAHHPDFTSVGALAPKVSKLVRKLEGIPLALELAAARVDVLGIDGLLGPLENALESLGSTYRDAEPARKTLRAALEWSWNLLTPDEQVTLAVCSVFRGSFSLRGVQALLDVSAAEALDRVHRLRDRSLMRNLSAHSIVAEPRFSLFEVVRELAAEKRKQLAAGHERRRLAEGLLERRHATYYAELASGLVREDGNAAANAALIERIDVERDNLVSALDWLLAEEEANVSAAHAWIVALALDVLFAARGPIDAHARRLERLLLDPRANDVDARLQARVLAAKGRADFLRGELGAARRSFVSAITRARALGDTHLEHSVSVDLGVLFHQQRDFEQAATLYEEALSSAVHANNAREVARLRGNLGALYHDMRSLPRARDQYLQALASYALLDEPRLEGVCWTNLGIIEQERGDLRNALDAYERGLALLERSGDWRLVAITLGNMGARHHEQGDVPRAIATHEQALRHLERVGDVHSQVLCLVRLAAALASNGDTAASTEHLHAASTLARRVQDARLRDVVEFHWAFVELAVAGALVVAGKPHEASAGRERARRRIASMCETNPAYGAALADVSDDVRTSLRILARILNAPPHAIHLDDGESDIASLVIGPDAAWYRTPAQACEDLRKNHPMRRILLALVEQASIAPSRALTLEALQDAAWPGERMQPDAGKNRVYVAIAQLRKRGLKEHLLRTEDGYHLAPTLRIRRSREAWPDG